MTPLDWEFDLRSDEAGFGVSAAPGGSGNKDRSGKKRRPSMGKGRSGSGDGGGSSWVGAGAV